MESFWVILHGLFLLSSPERMNNGEFIFDWWRDLFWRFFQCIFHQLFHPVYHKQCSHGDSISEKIPLLKLQLNTFFFQLRTNISPIVGFNTEIQGGTPLQGAWFIKIEKEQKMNNFHLKLLLLGNIFFYIIK